MTNRCDILFKCTGYDACKYKTATCLKYGGICSNIEAQQVALQVELTLIEINKVINKEIP